jgi:hypothetical protein
MKLNEFRKYLERDGGCLHCGAVEEAVPNHRANRGMGGSRKRNHPANIVVLCAEINGLIESDPDAARWARGYGWKLSSWENPYEVAVYDAVWRVWWLLDDNYGRTWEPLPETRDGL